MSGVYKELTQEFINQVQQYTYCTDIIDNANLFKLDFDLLNNAYKEIHHVISHTKAIKSDLLDEYQKLIDDYMVIYRRLFPNKTIPKLHLLEHHCIPFIKQHGFALGLMSEHGTEASHQSIALIEKRACGIVNKLKKQKFILETHIIQNFPLLRST